MLPTDIDFFVKPRYVAKYAKMETFNRQVNPSVSNGETDAYMLGVPLITKLCISELFGLDAALFVWGTIDADI